MTIKSFKPVAIAHHVATTTFSAGNYRHGGSTLHATLWLVAAIAILLVGLAVFG